jgi:hypothetical protein
MLKTLFKSIRLYVYCAIGIVAYLMQSDSYQWQNKFNARMMRWNFIASLETPVYIIYLNDAVSQRELNAGNKLKMPIEKLSYLQVQTIGVYIDLGSDLGDADSLLIFLSGQDHLIRAYSFSSDDTFAAEDAFSEFAMVTTGDRLATANSFAYQVAASHSNRPVDSWPKKFCINYRVNPSTFSVFTLAEILKENYFNLREKYQLYLEQLVKAYPEGQWKV